MLYNNGSTNDFANDGIDDHSSREFAKTRLSMMDLQLETPKDSDAWLTKNTYSEEFLALFHTWMTFTKPCDIFIGLKRHAKLLIRSSVVCLIHYLLTKSELYDPLVLIVRMNLLLDANKMRLEEAFLKNFPVE